MPRSFDVSAETGLSSDMVQLHGNTRARTWIVFGLFRASLLDLRMCEIFHSHHIMYQQWVDNCTCFRLLSRAQKTAEDRSSDASINIYLLLPPSSVLLPQLQYSCFQNQRAFLLCARVWLAFWCFQKLHAEPRCLKSRKELPRKCMCVETPKRNHLKQMCAPVRQ